MNRWVVFACALMSSWVSATTMVALDVDALTRSSDAVVRGKVVSVKAKWTSDHLRIVTETVIEVSESWKGAPTKLITVTQPGGEVDDIGQHVEGIASFSPTEEVVLFLEARGQGGERFTVAGLAQGRFHVEKSSDGAATYTRQDQTAHLLLIDPATHQPVNQSPLVFSIETLKKKVAVQAPVEPGSAKPGTTR